MEGEPAVQHLSFDDLPGVPASKPRQEGRLLARPGALTEVALVFTEGRQVPMPGVVLALAPGFSARFVPGVRSSGPA